MKVGVLIPLHRLFDQPDISAPSYQSLKSIAVAAEQEVLDSAWITDHLLFRFPPNYETRAVHEAFTIWAGIAEATNSIELGSMVLCTAFRNPALLAKMAVSLDEIANHRITLGVGCGWHEPEFKSFGIPFTHVVSKFEEAMSILHPLLRGGNVTFKGKYYEAVNCELVPPDNRPGGIPILIASTQPRMMDLTAKFAEQWNAAWLGDVQGYIEKSANLDAACARVGRDPSTIVKTAGVAIEFTDENVDPGSYNASKKIIGSVEHVAAKLRNYAEAGCPHVIALITALDHAKTVKLAEAARLASA